MVIYIYELYKKINNKIQQIKQNCFFFSSNQAIQSLSKKGKKKVIINKQMFIDVC